MKKYPVILLSALLLAGCASSPTESSSALSDSTSTSTSSTTTASSTAPDGSDNAEPLPFPLFGADGVQITFGDVTSMTDRDGNALTRETLEDTNWWEITCGGFAYLAEPTVCLNSVDDAELYDPETLLFGGAPEYTDTEYKRYKVGDKFGELTLKSVETVFSRVGYEEKDGVLTTEQIKAEGMCFAGMLRKCSAKFDGTIAMTGYMRVCVSEYGVEEGEVLFVPDKDSLLLPVMNFRVDRDTDSINTAVWQWNVNDFAYATEYPTIRLGNINKGTDIGGVPADGTSAKVVVTVTNISMFCDMYMSSFIDGELVSVELP
ncbi:MAG: hypothetical protein NC299_09885 [Lachnospiraceae bacterium]|nr:hypothetical protein [Ruminococcus sp.]MCM1275663.1 hypothetical protein [Lachnospiraceae bacterium]